MHFKDGQEAKIGQKIGFPVTGYENNAHYNTMRTGVILDIIPGTNTCNATVLYLEIRSRVHEGHTTHYPQIKEATVTLSECERHEGPPAGSQLAAAATKKV